jgi:uncharacterized membrane protein
MLYNKYSNPTVAINLLLKNKGVNINPDLIEKELGKHPDRWSLLGMSDVLDSFQIENEAYYIDDAHLAEMEGAFIAHTRQDGFITVNKRHAGYVFVSDDQHRNQKMPVGDFQNIFTGYILTVGENPQPGRGQSLTILTASMYYIMPVAAALLFLAALFLHHNYLNQLAWYSLLVTIIKVAGLATTVVLLMQGLNSNNPFIQKLCKGGEKTDCNAIINSPAAKIFKGLSWSEAGFFYFGGTVLLALFPTHGVFSWSVLFTVSLATLPYTFYSIYYQAKVAKQWCVFCCIVQALLWLEALTHVLLSGFNFKDLISALSSGQFAQWVSVGCCFLLPIILWFSIRPFLFQTGELLAIKKQFRQIKYNSNVFSALLNNRPQFTSPHESWSFALGNINATNIITMVSNVNCNPCGEAHGHLQALMDRNDNLQVRILFGTDNPEKVVVCRHLMALSRSGDQALMRAALHDWHARKDYQSWAKQYPVKLEDIELEQLKKQEEWCRMANILGSPTFF